MIQTTLNPYTRRDQSSTVSVTPANMANIMMLPAFAIGVAASASDPEEKRALCVVSDVCN